MKQHCGNCDHKLYCVCGCAEDIDVQDMDAGADMTANEDNADMSDMLSNGQQQQPRSVIDALKSSPSQQKSAASSSKGPFSDDAYLSTFCLPYLTTYA